ncbi:hypothetical protein [Winogradskyella psychrotolerans]|uniref:hypothetical protein n=1 Tax=Winogradskyella psychrotolerans TaxID=1344585 RepID=UPI001C076624|nr:hypothetical protein [Winogradskyella psychrotolerans]MBU2927854.1 hypothetical protein [Winogradskyella psychrotolerans]
MKHLHLLQIFVLALFMMSCSDDDNDSTQPLNDNPGMAATINGGTFNDYTFTDGTYNISLGTNGNTMSIDIADLSGNQVTLFLNGTGDFDSGTVKTMGDIDSNNFITYALIRQASPQNSYYSSSGNVTITSNRAHPTETGIRLISGDFDITASTLDDANTTTLIGSFTELEYEN